MSYLLNLVYLALLAAASPILLWRSFRTGKYRRGFAAKFLGLVPERASDRPCIWLHAVSVGEVNLLGTLIGELRRRRPEWEFVISTTTATGYEIATSKYKDHTVFYCPLDFSWAVRTAMRRVRPSLVVLAELELWPNLIAAAQASGAKVAIVNGRLSDRSFRGYRRLGWFVRPVLARLDVVAVQTEQYAERFRALGARENAVLVTGSLKFDGARTDRNNADTRRLSALAGIKPDDAVFLAGSTQAPEEELALAAFQQLSSRYPQLRLILVPRHPERFGEVASLLESSGMAWIRRSELDSTRTFAARILLVDRMGELGAWWGAAQIAYVGGSMGPREGQNMIEPAAYGAAVSFGPRTRNFRDVVALLLDREAAQVVHNSQDLTAFVERCLTEPSFAATFGQRAQQVVQSQLGATAKTCERLVKLVAETVNDAERRNAA